MIIKINEFKGLLTNTDTNTLPLEYSEDLENIVFEQGYIITKGLRDNFKFDFTPIKNILKFNLVYLRPDPLDYNNNKMQEKLYYVIIYTYEGRNLTVLINADNITDAHMLSNIDIPITTNAEDITIINEHGIVKISDGVNLWDIRRYSRKDNQEKIIAFNALEDYRNLNLGFSIKPINEIRTPILPLKMVNNIYVDTRRGEFTLINETAGLFYDKIFWRTEQIGFVYFLIIWFDNDLENGYKYINIKLNGEQLPFNTYSNYRYCWVTEVHTLQLEEIKNTLVDTNKLIFTTTSGISSNELFFPEGNYTESYIGTLIINNEFERVIYSSYDNKIPVTEKYVYDFELTGELPIYVTGYKFYIKRKSFNPYTYETIEDPDFKEIVSMNFYNAINIKLPAFWTSKTKGVLTTLSYTGVILSQNIGILYNEKTERIKSIQRYITAATVDFAIANGNLYYSPIGNGTIQKCTFYNFTMVPLYNTGIIKDIKKIGNDLAVISDNYINIIKIDNLDGQLLFTSRGNIPFKVIDAINVSSQLFILTTKGIFYSDGNNSPQLLSAQINNIVKANPGKIYYDNERAKLYYQNDNATYCYDFETQTWTRFSKKYKILQTDSKLYTLLEKPNGLELHLLDLKETKGYITFKSNLNEVYLYKILQSIIIDADDYQDIQVLVGTDELPRNGNVYYVPMGKRIPSDLIEFTIKGDFILRNIEIELDVIQRLRPVGVIGKAQ